MTPFYLNYPKDPVKNLEWRLACGERALTDIRFRNALYDACMEDVLFFMAFACWVIEPRAKIKVRAMIPWSHQESVFVAMDRAIDESSVYNPIDVRLDKSRAQGGTYGYLWILQRRWLRDARFSAGYVTRNEALVDSKTDDSTLFWKLAWGISMLPEWMKPKGFDMSKHRSLNAHTILNPENGATHAGFAAGQDVGAGGRKSVFACLAGNTLVVTDRGLVPIKEITLQDCVWDGSIWVQHDGLVYQGEQNTISAYGIRLTPDHRVLTVKGWTHGQDGYHRRQVRLPDGYQEKWCGQSRTNEMAMPMRLRKRIDCRSSEFVVRPDKELRLSSEESYFRTHNDSREVQNANISGMESHDSSMYESKFERLHALRRTWDSCVFRVAELLDVSLGYGRTSKRYDDGTHRQQRELLCCKLQVGVENGTSEQYSQEPLCGDSVWEDDDRSDCEEGGCVVLYDQMPHQERLDWGRTVSSTQLQEAVYDLLNCGPRRAFTVVDDCGRPLLVHNCDEFGARDFVSGGKDEAVMESLHDVSSCIFLVSARYVDQGVFHNACEDPHSGGLHLILDWKDHPDQSRNSYVVKDGKPVARKAEEQGAVDEYHRKNPDLRKRLEGKGFKWEGVVRAPWYDQRCLRQTATPRLIASQLDRDPRGAVGKVFQTELLDRMKKDCCRAPIWQGTPVFDSETLALQGLLKQDDGPLKLWFKPGPNFSCPAGPFTLGCDVAVGSDGAYSSNSVCCGVDEQGEQVMEYTIKGMPMIQFARVVVGLARWLRRALLGWEDAGVVAPFSKEICEVIYYSPIYYRTVEAIGVKKKTRKPGWLNSKDEHKADLFEKLALGMETGRFTPRSEDLIRECGEYEWDDGKIVHQPTKNRGAKEKAHGDRTIGAGVSWLIYSEGLSGNALDKSEEGGETPEYGSFLWREQREVRRVDSDSPEFGLKDVIAY